MIQTEFNHIIEADKYHAKYCLKGRNLGMLQLWAWNNSYIFLNFDTGKTSVLPIEGIEKKVKFISKEEYDKIYKERNYPDSIFENHYEEHHRAHYFRGDKTLYSERQQQYGLIHDNIIHVSSNTTNKLWTGDFCRSIAYMITSYYFYIMIMELYGTLKEARKDKEKFEKIFSKYFMSRDDYYGQYCDEMGLHDRDPKISEETIIKYIEKVKTLPEEYSKAILKSKLMQSKEFKYYLQKTVK